MRKIGIIKLFVDFSLREWKNVKYIFRFTHRKNSLGDKIAVVKCVKAGHLCIIYICILYIYEINIVKHYK